MNTIYALLIVLAPNGVATVQKFDTMDQCTVASIAVAKLERARTNGARAESMGDSSCIEIKEKKKE